MFLAIIVLILLILSVKIINQYQRGIVLTLGKYSYTLKPWLKFVIPIIQIVRKIDIREKAVDVPSQEAMTKDNVSCSINAVIYYKVNKDQTHRAFLNVKNLDYAMHQFAQTTMRNVVGQFDLDQLLTNREEASGIIRKIVDEKSDSWWVEVLSAELKDINIPDNLKRTMSKQAEAEREKRAKIISAEGEKISAKNLVEAAKALWTAPGAIHLRTLQSINDISSDQSNTTIWMLPLEVMSAFKGNKWDSDWLDLNNLSEDAIENVQNILKTSKSEKKSK